MEVPNLLGMTKEAAKKSLENLGLKLGKVTEGVSMSTEKIKLSGNHIIAELRLVRKPLTLK